MEIIYFLVPIGIVMLGVAIGLFSWAVKSDQFDDLDREGRRILFDEDMIGSPGKKTTNSPSKSAAPDKGDAIAVDAPPASTSPPLPTTSKLGHEGLPP